MGFEHENRNGEKGQRAPLYFDEADLSVATSRDGYISRMRRKTERRQSSALIAIWGDVERRSGKDQRASPSGKDITHD